MASTEADPSNVSLSQPHETVGATVVPRTGAATIVESSKPHKSLQYVFLDCERSYGDTHLSAATNDESAAAEQNVTNRSVIAIESNKQEEKKVEIIPDYSFLEQAEHRVKEREPIKSAASVSVPVSAMTVPVVELKELHVNEKQLLGKGSFGQVCKGN